MMNLIDKLLKENPAATNVDVIELMRKLIEPSEIQRFYRDYIHWMGIYGANRKCRTHAKDVVNENIGWALLSFTNEEAERWLDALPDIGYYGFGRTMPHPAFVFRNAVVLGEKEREYL